MLSHKITSNHNGFLITMELEGQFAPDQEDFMAYLIEMAKNAYNMYYTNGEDTFLDAVQDAVRQRDEENERPDEWTAGYEAGRIDGAQAEYNRHRSITDRNRVTYDPARFQTLDEVAEEFGIDLGPEND